MTYPNPIHHPLGPPVVSGTTITVDMMLNQPTRVTGMVADLTLQRFIADKIFTSAGGVSGGAVIFDMPIVNELYLSRDVERVEPGAEFPIVTSVRRAPNVALVEKWGGKFDFTDEAKDRNDRTAYTNQIRKLANTVVRKINQRAVEVLEAALTPYASRNITVSSSASWGDATLLAPFSSGYTPNALPHATLAAVNKQSDVEELGINYDLLLMNPQEWMNLRLVYSANGGSGPAAMLSDYGFSSYYVSNRVPAGSAYCIAQGQVGEMRIEKPLASETWREPGKEKTWTQTSVRPLMFVNNPYAVVKLQGLAL